MDDVDDVDGDDDVYASVVLCASLDLAGLIGRDGGLGVFARVQ